MADSAERSTILSPQGLVSLVRGIGDIRAKALAELNIYSIQDFLEYTETEDGILRVAGKIGMKSEVVIDLRSRVEADLRKGQPAYPEPKSLTKRNIIYALLAVINVLIIAAGILVEATSYYHFHHPSFSVVALFETINAMPISDYALRVYSTYDALDVRTEVELTNQYDLCFGGADISNIPQGVFFPSLTQSTFESASAEIIVVKQKEVAVGEGFVTLESDSETVFPLPVTIEDVSHIENYPGTNLIAWIDAGKMAGIRATIESMSHRECRFEFAAEFVDDVGATIIDPYRKGTISVLPFIYYSEAKYIGVENFTDDGMGSILELEEREVPDDYGIYTVEYS